ncbi:MAG: tripartite tricarboxylate transporter substrate binding protein [Chloroflexi bacterium]|nr:tripartite tricarboxylate transporter substrate binding protein [Chloroflexota bacterium]
MLPILRSARSRWGSVGVATLLAASLIAGGLLMSGCQGGEKYPSKPILMVVPYAPGGGTDIIARNFDKLAMDLKVIPQNFAIENKAGGGGIVGKSYGKEKPADGYTIVWSDDSSAYGDLMGNAPWKYNDFTFIAKMVSDYNMFIVRTESPIKDLKDMIAQGKANPKKLKVAGTGVGNTDQIQLALFTKNGGGDYTYVSFESGGQVMTNVLGGQVDAALANPSEAYEQIRAGKVRALGYSAPERVQFNDPVFKDTPTWKEAGVNLSIAQWRGVVGPPGMKKEHVDWLINAFKKVSDSKEWKEQYLDKFQQMNAFISGDAFKKAVEDEYASFRPVFNELGLTKKK